MHGVRRGDPWNVRAPVLRDKDTRGYERRAERGGMAASARAVPDPQLVSTREKYKQTPLRVPIYGKIPLYLRSYKRCVHMFHES
jgi:hypothetical protein